MSYIGYAVKSIRESKELTQRELALKSNTTQGTIARIEKGTRTPSLSLLESISKALSVNLFIIFLVAENKDQRVKSLLPIVNYLFLE